MRKQVFGRQFKRDINERKALFKGLITSLVIHERIQTTEEKAKAIRPTAEKLITKALKKDRLQAYSLLQPYMTSPAVEKMLTDVAPRFSSRPGGYTRIVKIGKRFNDNATMVIMEWVEKKKAVVADKAPKAGKETVEASANVAKPKKAAAVKKKKAAPKKEAKAKTATKKEKKK